MCCFQPPRVTDSPFQVWPGLYLLLIGRINNFLKEKKISFKQLIFLFIFLHKKASRRHDKVVKSSKGTLIPVMWTNQLLSRQSPCISQAFLWLRIPTGKCWASAPSELRCSLQLLLLQRCCRALALKQPALFLDWEFKGA